MKVMSGIFTALGKKTLGLALIFNSLISLTSALRILSGFYAARPWWRPFSPYLLDGSLFWAVIPASILNIAPARVLGRVKIRRFLFHHYVYGLFVTLVSTASVHLSMAIPSSQSPLRLSYGRLNGLTPYVETFFIYGGLTLLLDDISDISPRVKSFLRWLGEIAERFCKPIRASHALCSLASIYISLSIGLWFCRNRWVDLWSLDAMSYIVLMASILVTGIFGLRASLKGTALSV
ncbi:hypothetical protein CW711_04600 [Candidatus Bathyarchaeota archaeon]|nr:MAG: hypothetical protein B6U84_01525 [Candidatus Bathyarchaeota archaeon ex4484_40]RJS78741.1 MAG: hypothetical protein CW711_04600 [Candidatus Bathyarchaeota archaeon]RLG98157.1 MAG: hypothetical protein DRO29_01545 [Candidatus Bathyarchaeota archaeon]